VTGRVHLSGWVRLFAVRRTLEVADLGQVVVATRHEGEGMRPGEILPVLTRCKNGVVEPLEASPGVRSRMSRQKSRNTQIEMMLRRALHARGLRYRLHKRPVPGVRREADIVFPSVRVAVFVDGCFWHGCPDHATWPKNNADFWRAKIEGNRRRDVDTDVRFADAGWCVVRVWEHEPVDLAALRVYDVVETRRRAMGYVPRRRTPRAAR
jgi:DNA mismatch endonuclease (patch repair protein)